MNREEYLKQLKAALKSLPEDELQDILYDYEEHFDIGLSKGKSEKEISAELGDPKEIAKNHTIAPGADPVENIQQQDFYEELNFSKDKKAKAVSKKIPYAFIIQTIFLYFNFSIFSSINFFLKSFNFFL